MTEESRDGSGPCLAILPVMATTLRDLLIQRAARLQDRPALTALDWGTLSYAQLRNRVEGVALGLLAAEPPSTVFCATGTAWDWAAELAAAASRPSWPAWTTPGCWPGSAASMCSSGGIMKPGWSCPRRASGRPP